MCRCPTRTTDTRSSIGYSSCTSLTVGRKGDTIVGREGKSKSGKGGRRGGRSKEEIKTRKLEDKDGVLRDSEEGKKR